MELLVTKVRSAVRSCCPHYLAGQAEDVAQEVLLQLIKKVERGEGKRGFSSMYLLKAAHGATVDEIRRRSRRQEVPVSEDEMNELLTGRPDPEQEALGRTLGREIRRCLEGLSVSRRAAVTLHLLGCSISEISSRLGCPKKGADNRVYRGMKDLRECLQAKGLTP